MVAPISTADTCMNSSLHALYMYAIYLDTTFFSHCAIFLLKENFFRASLKAALTFVVNRISKNVPFGIRWRWMSFSAPGLPR